LRLNIRGRRPDQPATREPGNDVKAIGEVRLRLGDFAVACFLCTRRDVQAATAPISDRPHVESATFQPFIIHNLEKGWYLRSTGIWTFDLKNNTHYIPLGLGGGKAWKSGSNILNAFIEPQWTVDRKGDGLPQFTLFAGINVTFGK